MRTAAAESTFAATSRAAAERWVEMFAQGWADPGDPDRFHRHFEPWLDPEVRMVQPQLRPLVGLAAFRDEFVRPLFELVPDLHGTVEGWSATGNVIYIELRLQGTVGRRRFELRTCDRVTLRDGRAIERVAHLDPSPLLAAILRSPSAWPRFVRMQLRGLRRVR
jgi:hypothetical protein